MRKCDGYYFPIGFATPKSEFKRDQAVCRSFYPDGEADLYVYPSGSDDAKTMVSLGGEAYAEQPFAFVYRSAYQPACAAMLQAGVKAAAEKAHKTVEIKASAIVPIPVPRPSLNDPKAIVEASESRRVAAADQGEGKVRVVGAATPYLLSKPANSAPERVVPAGPGAGTVWLEQFSIIVAPAARADDGAQ